MLQLRIIFSLSYAHSAHGINSTFIGWCFGYVLWNTTVEVLFKFNLNNNIVRSLLDLYTCFCEQSLKNTVTFRLLFPEARPDLVYIRHAVSLNGNCSVGIV